MNTESTINRVPFVDLATQYAGIARNVNEAIAGVLARTDFILGQDVHCFEEEFAAFCETRYAIGVDSGTTALEMILHAYGIGPGDQVITAANTFIATVLAISYAGATPVLVDVDPHTYLMAPSMLEEAITAHTKAIIPVHLYGQPVDMDAVLEIALRHNLVVIEDACQAHGARYNGKRAGSLGHAAAFSFYPAKNLGAYGDGGMVVTNDERVAESVRMLRNYGSTQKYHHVLRGYNHRLDTLQAAVLRAKLPHLDDWNAARRQVARLYSQLLTDSPVALPETAEYAEHVYHLYVVRVEERNALQAHLRDKGIATGIHYPVPVHLQPAYQELGYARGDFPITEQYAEQILSLPMCPELSREMVEYVAEAIKDFVVQHRVEPLLMQSTG